jgi:3-oxoacyl-[acyl-carrier-protein] synthase-1
MSAVPLSIAAYTASCAAGSGRRAILDSLRERRSGLAANTFTDAPLDTFIGRVGAVESQPLPPHLEYWECRNNRLAWHGLQQDGFFDAVRVAREKYGPDRIALVLGTSTSSIGATEEGYRRLTTDGQYPEELRRPPVHTVHSLGSFVQQALGLTGISVTVGRSIRRARASASVRRRASPCWSGRAMARDCSDTASRAMRTTCPRPIRKGSVPAMPFRTR